ncbi:MAG TPA: IclR family transcriptional regulator [Chloroflexota bacterium]|jgi:IclR family acetate operon transcriptional repressor|nr:IclR family transcriptional regulator [Chloroflexota bacterium]
MSNALKQGLRTLEFLAEQPRSAAEVARHLSVDRSTGWRILQVLIEQGWVRQGTGAAPFSLDVSRLYALARSGHEHLALPGLLMPALTRVRDRLGESAIFGVPSGTSMVYLVFVSSLHAVTVREAVGYTRPMHASALGKAYLSALDDRDLDTLLSALDYTGGTPRAVMSALELRQVVQTAREHGYATDIEETLPGVICVATPVHVGAYGLLIGALSVSGPRERLLLLGLERVAQVIKEEVASLEAKFLNAGELTAGASLSTTAS